ncbi:hypothetical protein GmHk_19G054737 [Glycine max]|nr:hypothetical protein GmHk_19G054737 [Glycine max]
MVHVNPTIGKADSPPQEEIKNIFGDCRRDVRELEASPCCSEGFEMGGYLAKFDIPEASDVRTKKKILQTVGERWRQFKSDLTSKWALAADKESVDDTVCKK